ncbi:hypothetical protein HK097_001431 [Rhizophlyctis rosea]|uniref:Uncharacterized protein n=1 Tax=Rhizophlyctis rosea TaxID=64517 RepID=A0AAD5S6Q8_9FUNG|nr:hypothetical protein HK097_001431 [Rhizophlyctis rosea]
MLSKLPKLTGAGNPETFLEYLKKADEILLFSKRHISEREFLSFVKVSASGTAADFLKTLWNDPYLTARTWHDVFNDDNQLVSHGLPLLLLSEYKSLNYDSLVLNRFDALKSAGYKTMSDFNVNFKLALQRLPAPLPAYVVTEKGLDSLPNEVANLCEPIPLT